MGSAVSSQVLGNRKKPQTEHVAWGLASTSRLSYFLETDGLTREEIAIIEKSLQGKKENREVADDSALEQED